MHGIYPYMFICYPIYHHIREMFYRHIPEHLLIVYIAVIFRMF